MGRGLCKGWGRGLLGAWCAAAFVALPLAAAQGADGGWWGEAGVLYLAEETQGQALFWIDRSGNGILDAGESRFGTDQLTGWGWGWRAEVGYTWPGGRGLSVGWTGRLDSRSRSIGDPSDNIEPRFGRDPNNCSGALCDLEDFEDSEIIKMGLDSTLHSWDVNYNFPVHNFSPALQLRGRVGPRVIWLKDDLKFKSFDEGLSDPLNRADLGVDTENWFIGAQVGLGLQWQVCPWFSVLADANVGGYYASMDQDVSYREFDGFRDAWSLSDSQDTGGFLAELRLAGDVRITRNISARLGYMLLWLSNTARAINQIKPGQGLDEDLVDIAPASYPRVQRDGTLYHGGMLSVVVKF
jgi:hypothetical protein